ncbi:hypothetical protein [Pantoea cypripedii]|nr:hypothetical protein [Pantoea cypripedii]
MKSISEQRYHIAKWIESDIKWTHIGDQSGDAIVGSTGVNKVIGYLYNDKVNTGDLTVVYEHISNTFDYSNSHDHQLSILLFSLWEKYMKPISQV